MAASGPGRGWSAWCCAALLAAAPHAIAERLPLRAYTTADGLAHDHVNCLFPDSRGFLWLCTAQGLSRFDGRRFVTYGTEHGLDELYVNDFVETQAHEYWVATNGKGVFRFDPAPGARQRLFVRHPVGAGTASNRVNALWEDGSRRLWAGTDDGFYVWDRKAPGGGFQPAATAGASSAAPALQVGAFGADAGGRLWALTSAGVMRIDDDARIARAARQEQSPFALLASFPGQECMLRHSGGHVFVGGRHGLAELGGEWPRRYTTEHGLSDDVITALGEDRSGNLWIGSETGGVMRLAFQGLTTFDDKDGLGHKRVTSVFETRAGELCVVSAQQYLNVFDRRGFTPVRPALPAAPSLQAAHAILQDSRGEWWLASPRGLARYAPAPSAAALAGRRPKAVYTAKDGLASDDVAWPFEDAHGDIWTAARRAPLLTRWERATGAFTRYSDADGLPAGNAPVAFGEDAAGALWVGFREGGLARRRGARFEFFGEAAGVPATHTRQLHRDRLGRLWAASAGGGLIGVEAPEGEPPRFVRYGLADGFTSEHVRCLTSDDDGRLYLGTATGVARFDPRTRAVTHYTTGDGLAQNEIQSAYRDSTGQLWFGTMAGVSRLVPREAERRVRAPVFIGAVTVAGAPRPIAALGERVVEEFDVEPGNASVRIDYLGFAWAPGAGLQFQYRLLGGDGRWSAPTARDSVEYGALAPGRYRFEVRADQDEEAPASVAFVVHPPLWRRWWFSVLMAAGLILVGYLLHRARLRRALELEKVRTRIASDLHDDIGSNLSQIAILTEVAARGLGAHEPQARELLGSIAAKSRETVDSMSDIVWAINPQRDRLGDLVHRMRRVASDAFTAREIEFRFQADMASEDLEVGADLRRQVFLVFKEAVHNAARHAQGRRAEAQVSVDSKTLRFTLSDDGRGFEPGAHDGHGLWSMSKRAQSLGGRFEVASQPGRGTTVTLTVPLHPGATLPPA